MRFDGRTGLVTGVEGPLGAAVARALSAAGARLWLVSADPKISEKLAGELAAAALPSGAQMAEAVELLVEATPLPTLPARFGEANGALGMTLAAAERPVLRLAETAARMGTGGSALLLSASSGPVPPAGWMEAHLAWRAAAVAGLGRELTGQGVRVNGLAPVVEGVAKLPGFLKKGAKALPPTPLGRAADPEEVAEAALWLLGARMLTGMTLPLDGGRSL